MTFRQALARFLVLRERARRLAQPRATVWLHCRGVLLLDLSRG